MPQLGQLVASHVTEVEDIKEKQYRAMGEEVLQAHRLLEASAEIESGGDVSYSRSGVISVVFEGSAQGCVHDVSKATT